MACSRVGVVDPTCSRGYDIDGRPRPAQIPDAVHLVRLAVPLELDCRVGGWVDGGDFDPSKGYTKNYNTF